ncbi:MAG: DNA transformation protein [bacterium]|jgi:DNA transformation protein
MGVKGDKHISDAAETAALIEGRLNPIGDVTTKKMFGGYGIFHEAKMFGLISPKGAVFIKFDDSTLPTLQSLGGERHSKMPYFLVPNNHLESAEFVYLVDKAIVLSK